MKIALIYGAWSLSFRKDFDFSNLPDDPRGLSGSEMAFVRLGEELGMAADVTAFTIAKEYGATVRPLDELDQIDESYDVAMVINEPDLLRPVRAKLKVCYHLINSFEFLVDKPDHVDLWLSPSEPHRQMVLGQDHIVGHTQGGSPGTWKANPENWKTLHLGCDLPDVSTLKKVPGRVIYCSSPDRGLHWLLQEWPAIKRAVPHAHLRIFYRLQPWLDQWEKIGYHKPIEPLRARALYIKEALRRMRHLGIEVVDSVSRNQIAREMSEAEVMAYPCDTTRWTEGFSCSLLEGCAAQACPVTTDVDALGAIYGKAIPTLPRGDWNGWRLAVIEALQNKNYRDAINTRARALAETMTWAETVRNLLSAIEVKS